MKARIKILLPAYNLEYASEVADLDEQQLDDLRTIAKEISGMDYFKIGSETEDVFLPNSLLKDAIVIIQKSE